MHAGHPVSRRTIGRRQRYGGSSTPEASSSSCWSSDGSSSDEQSDDSASPPLHFSHTGTLQANSVVTALAFHPLRAATLGGGCVDGRVHVWNCDTGQGRVLARHSHRVDAVAFQPRGAPRSSPRAAVPGPGGEGANPASAGSPRRQASQPQRRRRRRPGSARTASPRTPVSADTSKKAAARSGQGNGDSTSSHSAWGRLRGVVAGVAEMQTLARACPVLATGCQASLVRLWKCQPPKLSCQRAGSVESPVSVARSAHTSHSPRSKSTHSPGCSPRARNPSPVQTPRTARSARPTHWIGQLSHSAAVKAIAFDPVDALVMATGTADGVVRWWDVPTKACSLYTRPALGCSALSLAFNPGGGHVLACATGSENAVRVWSAGSATAALVLRAESSCLDVKYASETTLVSAHGDGGVRVWDLRTCRVVHTLLTRHGRRRRGHAAVGTGAAVNLGVATLPSHSAGFLVAAAYADGNARLWSVGQAQARLESAIEHDEPITRLAVSQSTAPRVAFCTGTRVHMLRVDVHGRGLRLGPPAVVLRDAPPAIHPRPDTHASASPGTNVATPTSDVQRTPPRTTCATPSPVVLASTGGARSVASAHVNGGGGSSSGGASTPSVRATLNRTPATSPMDVDAATTGGHTTAAVRGVPWASLRTRRRA